MIVLLAFLNSCHNDVANKLVNCRSFSMTRVCCVSSVGSRLLGDCRSNASSTSRRSSLSSKSLVSVHFGV
ncbi:hypothetical protein T10_1678 [Trichinella papuae]|uniref:Uncharacterized protein n=1 Tax=Trichinella papuae TaxID=268474 RepID=A0A0V1N6B7_9BILA|nr:hypothetical protein T10_1678 [Trichinella papuae]